MKLIFVRAQCPQLGLAQTFRFSVGPTGVQAVDSNSFVWGFRDSQILGVELRTQPGQILRLRDEDLDAYAQAARAELEN